jgi:hypothetical protein
MPVPTTEEDVNKILFTPARWHIVEARVAAAAPQRGAIFSALRENYRIERNWPIGQRDIAPGWGAGRHEPLSTNMPPRWSGKDFFTPSEVVAIDWQALLPTLL